MKIALASEEFINGNIHYNMDVMLTAMETAKARGASLVCFGEAFLQGFDSLKWRFSVDRNIAVKQDSIPIKTICRKADEIGVDVFFGYLELAADCIYSSYALVENNNVTYNYRRISKGWKEYMITDGHYREGEKPALFYYKDKKCLAALCGDLWDYPERFIQDEDILFWPVYVDFPVLDWKERHINDYTCRAGAVARNVLLINSICKPSAVGGCYHFRNNRAVSAFEPGNKGLLIVEID